MKHCISCICVLSIHQVLGVYVYGYCPDQHIKPLDGTTASRLLLLHKAIILHFTTELGFMMTAPGHHLQVSS
ncbi:hypothetical protein QBC32DRAFT_331130 [Pseudoneurospora amorphoporcata]|uniref:Secreted protein n=1 Tax=Pseudoneurospora amorphoporcata TaxID=241081 RepID=A0AAN6SK71_9PEZI|nr:hypothetical protein QBC32DRAFT_331130 [Pseudoneurospora amorphoporcata]